MKQNKDYAYLLSDSSGDDSDSEYMYTREEKLPSFCSADRRIQESPSRESSDLFSPEPLSQKEQQERDEKLQLLYKDHYVAPSQKSVRPSWDSSSGMARCMPLSKEEQDEKLQQKIDCSSKREDTSDSEDEEEWPYNGATKRKLNFKRVKRLASSDDDSDSKASFSDGLDENLMGDKEDRKRLKQMSEREREQELFSRAEKREAKHARFEIYQKLKAKDKPKTASVVANAGSRTERELSKNSRRSNMQTAKSNDNFKPKQDKKKKRGRLDSDSVYGDESCSSSSSNKENHPPAKNRKNKMQENKKKHVTSRALAQLVEKREKKKKQSMLEELARELITSGSSESSSSDSDPDDNQPSASPPKNHALQPISTKEQFSRMSVLPPKNYAQPISTKEQLNRMRLSRDQLEQWCHMPFFKQTVQGAYVRVGIGKHMGTDVYRVTKVVDVVETAKVYDLGKTRTNKGLLLKFGGSQRVFRMAFMSNQDFRDGEFFKWKETVNDQKLPLPTTDDVLRKERDIQMALDYRFKDADIDKIVAEKQRFQKNPHNYAAKKTELLKQMLAAKDCGDDASAERLQKQIDALEQRAEELHKARTSNIKEISSINQRHRTQNVTKAVVSRERQEEDYGAADPFTRKRSLPTVTRQQVEQQYARKQTQPTNPEQPTQSVKKPATPETMNSLFNAHNFDANVNITGPALAACLPGGSTMVQPTVSTMQKPAPKRSLNLAEYKIRRGLI